MGTDAAQRAMALEQHGSYAGSVLLRAARWFRGTTAVARRMRHVETLPLGRSHSLYLVECDGMHFLVSACSHSLSAPVPLAGSLGMAPAVQTHGTQTHGAPHMGEPV